MLRSTVPVLLLAGIFGFTVFGFSGPALSQPEDGRASELTDRPFTVTADELEYESERDLYVARGNVKIVQEDRTLTADWVAFNERTRLGVASGNVVIQEGPDTLHAEFLQFDVGSLRGVVFDGELRSRTSRFRMQGEELQRTGDETYVFREARFTTCDCPDEGRDPWALRAEQADLEVGGYGTARNTTFELLGIPVLWFPWMIYPLKTERETGFLFPELGASTRSGGDYGLPFFWAAGDRVNVLLTPAWVSKRGFKPSAQIEYVFGQRSEGDASVTWIRDREIDPDDPSTPFPDDRWAARWQHDHFLPADWRFQVDSRFVSDNLYPFDFYELRDHRADRFLESTGFVSRHFGGFDRLGFAGGVRFADDLQSPDDIDRDDVLLQRLPELELRWVRDRVGVVPRLVRALDVDYAHFRPLERPESQLPTAAVVGDDLFLDTGIDGVPNREERDAQGVFSGGDGHQDDFPFGFEGDGRFQEGEPLADRGHRLVVSPRFGVPLRLGDLVELAPEVGYHGTFYQTDAQGFEARHLATGRVTLRGQLERRFRRADGRGALLHVVEPRLGWALVSSSSQGTNPLFVPATALPQQRLRQLELDNVTRDPADRIESANDLVAALDQRLYRTGEDGLPRLWADATLQAAYRFAESEWGLLLAQGSAYPGRSLRARFLAAYDLEETRLAEAAFGVSWNHEAGHALALSYRYLRQIPVFFESFRFERERFDEFEGDFTRVNQLALSTRAVLTSQWSLTYRLAYSFENSLVLSNAGAVEYISKCRCWAIALELSDDRSSGLDVRLRYRLIGLGDDRGSPFDS